ncbi:alternative ribosome rescue aminoacyl-tRNA hydrolase ArfB [Soonwooa sp.]|uniref:alternative ribosome rescue aminoacyl-tRNA hydrolase ArfB n=1 Tax=Soonwooa sp. TaxID=1938592 RepID=UPI0028ADF4EA|nr:alternative ribosome rescue aminoacyl-tRNA hydrolase ArfB [Soonwooa sp.]
MNDFSKELSFKTSRSGGAGGQNVNKVETAVTAMWKVSETNFFSQEQIEKILEKLNNRINNDGILQLTSTEARTQFENKAIAIERILNVVNASVVVQKPRKKTKPRKSQIEKRLTAKKILSEKKDNRRFRY